MLHAISLTRWLRSTIPEPAAAQPISLLPSFHSSTSRYTSPSNPAPAQGVAQAKYTTTAAAQTDRHDRPLQSQLYSDYSLYGLLMESTQGNTHVNPEQTSQVDLLGYPIQTASTDAYGRPMQSAQLDVHGRPTQSPLEALRYYRWPHALSHYSSPSYTSSSSPYSRPSQSSSYDYQTSQSQDAYSAPSHTSSWSADGYEVVRNPRAFFKKGRVFKINWAEPNASSDTVYVKPRMFVVMRFKPEHCICLPIYTYSQQGTAKVGTVVGDHAPLVEEGCAVYHAPGEDPQRLKKALYIIIEDPSIQWDPYSRINFGKVSTVEYNVKIKKVGRISPGSLADLESSFLQSLALEDGVTILSQKSPTSAHWPPHNNTDARPDHQLAHAISSQHHTISL